MFLLLLAVIPGAFLVNYVYKLDKIEQEPRWLIRKLIIWGMLVCFPVCLAEVFAEDIIGVISAPGSFSYDVLTNFLGVALIEEFGKYYVMKKYTWKSTEFNYRFDAIVYACCASMGFAILENIFYVCMEGGISVAIMRAFLSIPGHFVFAVFMGYHYGEAKRAQVMGDRAGCKNSLNSALITPMILHGFYDFCLTRDSGLWLFVFYVFVFILYKKAFADIKKFANADIPLFGSVNTEYK